MNYPLHLLTLFLLLIMSFFFSAAETAVFSLSKMEKRRLATAHPLLAKWVMIHLEHPRRTLTTIVICNLFVNTLSASLATLLFYHAFGASSVGWSLVFFTVVSIVFFEIVPKTIAVRRNELISLWTALPLQTFVFLSAPLRRLVRIASDKLLVLLLPGHKEHPDQISSGELKTLIKIGEEEGVLDSQERYMLQKLFDLGERQVKAIMTPRIDLAALDIEETREKHIVMIQKYHFTHFPVYQNSIDNLLGFVSVQDYMLNPEMPLHNILKQPLFIPEKKRIDDLLAEFRQQSQNLAVCVDEYGGTAGIVTLEDILEEIFGEFYDEYAKVENPVRPIGNHEFMVDAKISLADFNEYFSFNLKSEDASTLAGFILEKMGKVPEKGSTLKIPDCEIRIHDVLRHRSIKSVVVRPES